MRTGTVELWAQNLGVGRDEVLPQVRRFLRLIDSADERVLGLRIMLHRSPDPNLDDALLQLERHVKTAHDLLADLHGEVLKELS